MRSWGILGGLVDLILAAGVFLVFGRAWRGSWLFDDPAILDMEFQLERRQLAGNLALMFRRPWLPDRLLTHLGYQWTYDVAGLRVEAWHIVNVAMHAGASVMVHRLMLGWVDPFTAAAVAAVFAFHPLQVSAVCYISGRAGLQSVLFTLAGLMCFQLHAWPAAIVSQWFAWKSKEDAIVYTAFYPICGFLFTRMPDTTALPYGAFVYSLTLIIRSCAGFFHPS